MSASTEARDELLRLREDAERYRFLRKIILRDPERTTTGVPIYQVVLQRDGKIDAEQLDQLLDECRKNDDGTMTTFGTGELPAHTATPSVARGAERGTNTTRVYCPKPCKEPTCGKMFVPTGPRADFCKDCR